MSIIIDYDKQNHRIVYLTELPETSIQIKTLCGHELKVQRYWFDYKNLRIISKTTKSHKYPYLVLRGNNIEFNFKDIGKKHYYLDRFVQALDKSYRAKH